VIHQNHHYHHLGKEAEALDHHPLHNNPGKDYNYRLAQGEWYHGYLFHNTAVLHVTNPKCRHKSWYEAGPDCEYYILFINNTKVTVDRRFPNYSCKNVSMCRSKF